MRRLVLSLCLPFALLTGCARSPQIEAPDGFAELDGGETYSFRATTASGVVLAVRAEDNDVRGNLEFWSRALDNRLQKGGYTKVALTKIKTASDLEGRRFRYEIDRSGRKHEYWMTVFVTPSRVVVVEAGGDEAFFDADTEREVERAIRSIEI
jgi:hypothetical protein